jgi:hypothetical protein
LSTPSLAGGAIAVDDQNIKAERIVFGHAFGGSPTEAAKEALKKCDTANCKVMIKFTDKCGAFAASKRSYGVGSGATKAVAQAAALENCGGGDCAVVMAECE